MFGGSYLQLFNKVRASAKNQTLGSGAQWNGKLG